MEKLMAWMKTMFLFVVKTQEKLFVNHANREQKHI